MGEADERGACGQLAEVLRGSRSGSDAGSTVRTSVRDGRCDAAVESLVEQAAGCSGSDGERWRRGEHPRTAASAATGVTTAQGAGRSATAGSPLRCSAAGEDEATASVRRHLHDSESDWEVGGAQVHRRTRKRCGDHCIDDGPPPSIEVHGRLPPHGGGTRWARRCPSEVSSGDAAGLIGAPPGSSTGRGGVRDERNRHPVLGRGETETPAFARCGEALPGACWSEVAQGAVGDEASARRLRDVPLQKVAGPRACWWMLGRPRRRFGARGRQVVRLQEGKPRRATGRARRQRRVAATDARVEEGLEVEPVAHIGERRGGNGRRRRLHGYAGGEGSVGWAPRGSFRPVTAVATAERGIR